jgi:beta-lactamase superfamily II metal-dependent hydrolase
MNQVFDDFVSKKSTPLKRLNSKTNKYFTAVNLLWGDGVKILDANEDSEGRIKVRSRNKIGWVSKAALGGKSLLEIYFIDVGQGDGILIKTPSFKHIMIDGGNPRKYQDTKKNAADFVDWKFYKDYGLDTIELDAMIASHCDMDHYGGLSDLLDVTQIEELDAKSITIESFYHAGLSHWLKNGKASLGSYIDNATESYWTQLLEDRPHALNATKSGNNDVLKDPWKGLISSVIDSKTKAGSQTEIKRLSNKNGYLPSFEKNTKTDPAIKILGPVEFDINGSPSLRRFDKGDKSQNTNGVSLLLRVDFGKVRILLTGDLNKLSQKALLDDYNGNESEFACDVCKACHHGSDDISYEFLQAINAGATIISSGDNENYDHPRPSVIAASATTGYLQFDSKQDLVTPLVYSTELARSIKLGSLTKIELKQNGGQTIENNELSNATYFIDSKDKVNYKPKVVKNLIYGLVNVRTDGKKILCATLDEKSSNWKIKEFNSRF